MPAVTQRWVNVQCTGSDVARSTAAILICALQLNRENNTVSAGALLQVSIKPVKQALNQSKPNLLTDVITFPLLLSPRATLLLKKSSFITELINITVFVWKLRDTELSILIISWCVNTTCINYIKNGKDNNYNYITITDHVTVMYLCTWHACGLIPSDTQHISTRKSRKRN